MLCTELLEFKDLLFFIFITFTKKIPHDIENQDKNQINLILQSDSNATDGVLCF